MHFILSYFDQVIGPRILFSSHPNLTDFIEDSILNLININSEHEGFFKFEIISEKIEAGLANYLFKIPSEWARGRNEIVLLSVVLDPIQNGDIFIAILEKYSEIIRNEPDIYKAFYVDSDKSYGPEISVKYARLKEIFEDFCKASSDLLVEMNLGIIAVLGPSFSGKTSYLNAVKGIVFDYNIKPTLGIQISRVVLGNYRLNAFDVGGQTKFTQLFRRLPAKPKGIIIMMDVQSDSEKIIQTRNLLKNVIEHFKCYQNSIPILIIANKIDLKPDFKAETLIKWLELDRFKDIEYEIFTVSALKNIRVLKSFRWLVKKIIEKGI